MTPVMDPFRGGQPMKSHVSPMRQYGDSQEMHTLYYSKCLDDLVSSWMYDECAEYILKMVESHFYYCTLLNYPFIACIVLPTQGPSRCSNPPSV